MFVEDEVACMLACFIQEAADDCHYYCAIHHHELACLKCLYNYDHGEVETDDEEEEEKEGENHRSYS
jgi:hypothetical protein